eukprot:5024765-Amphidinium_carterae.1
MEVTLIVPTETLVAPPASSHPDTIGSAPSTKEKKENSTHATLHSPKIAMYVVPPNASQPHVNSPSLPRTLKVKSKCELKLAVAHRQSAWRAFFIEFISAN